jgi:hypothetical protein
METALFRAHQLSLRFSYQTMYAFLITTIHATCFVCLPSLIIIIIFDEGYNYEAHNYAIFPGPVYSLFGSDLPFRRQIN